MANESVLVFRTGEPIPFTVNEAVAIPKGTICTMSDPLTAAANAGKETVVAGISASEKIASDGKVKLGIYRQGIFKILGSGSITAGDAVITASDGNEVETAGTAVEDILGTALESSTDGETLLVELNPFTINQA